jgi:esterase/lipase
LSDARSGLQPGVLLLHGLSGSPAELYPLASELRAAGYRVSSPTLDDMAVGTDMDSQQSWRDWLCVAEKQYEELAKVCDTVHVCGFFWRRAPVVADGER